MHMYIYMYTIDVKEEQPTTHTYMPANLNLVVLKTFTFYVRIDSQIQNA